MIIRLNKALLNRHSQQNEQKDGNIKAISQKILDAKSEDVAKVIKQIIGEQESREALSVACNKVDLTQWIDVLNKFDEILEKIIAKSAILLFGDKSKKHPKQTPTKDIKTSQKTPNVDLIISILEFTNIILSQCKVGIISYHSLDRIASLLNSENLDIIYLSLKIVHTHFKKRSALSDREFLSMELARKLTIFTKGYGENTVQYCYEENLPSDVMQAGTTLNFSIFQEYLEQGKQHQSADFVEQITIMDVKKTAPDALSLFNDLMKKEGSSAGKLLPPRKFELWTNIRLAYAFYNSETRKKALVCRLMALAVTVDISEKNMDIVKELTTCFEKDESGVLKLPKEIAIASYDLFSAFLILHKSKYQALTIQSLITHGSSTYNGLVQRLLGKITKKFLHDSEQHQEDILDDRTYLTAALDLLVTLARLPVGTQALHETGLTSDIINLLQAKSDFVVMKAICMVELFTDPKQRFSSLPIILTDTLKVFSDLIAIAVPKIREVEEKHPERKPIDVSNFAIYELLNVFQVPTLSACLRIFDILCSHHNDLNISELFEAQHITELNQILENHLWFGPSVLYNVISLLTRLASREPTQIPAIRNSGAVEKALLLIKNEVAPYSKLLIAVVPFLSEICLNTECLEIIEKENIIPQFLQLFSKEKYGSILSKEYSATIGKGLLDFIKSYTSTRECNINAIVSVGKSLLSNIEDEKVGEIEQLTDAGTNLISLGINFLAFVAQVLTDKENTTLFLEKGGLPVLTNILDRTLIPHPEKAIDFSRISTPFQVIAKSKNSQVLDTFTDLLIQKLQILKDDVKIEEFSHLRAVFCISKILPIMINVFKDPDELFLNTWNTKGKEILVPLAKIEAKLRNYFTSQRTQRISDRLVVQKKLSAKSDDKSAESVSSEAKTPMIEESSEDAKARAHRTFITSTISNYLKLVTTLHETMQTAIFDIVKSPSVIAVTEAKKLASILTTNFGVALEEFGTFNGTWQDRTTLLQSIFENISAIMIKERYRNLNSLILSSLVETKTLGIMLDHYSNMVQLALDQNISYDQAPSVNDLIKTIEYTLSDEFISQSFLTNTTKFLLRITSHSYISTSPITRGVCAATSFDISDLLKKTQQNVATCILKFWKHSNIDKSPSTFLKGMINVIGQIIKGVESSKTPTTTAKEKAESVTENESLVQQLVEMGFPEKQCRVALRKANNELMVAMEWIFNNPQEVSEQEEELEEEDEISKAIKLSMLESGMEDEEPAKDSVVTLEEESSNWLLSKLFIPDIGFACVDVLSLCIQKNEALKDTFVNLLMEKLNSDITEEKSKPSTLGVMRSSLEYSEDFKNLILSKKNEFMGLLLKIGEVQLKLDPKEPQVKETLISLFTLFIAITQQKKLNDIFSTKKEKITTESLVQQLQVFSLVEEEYNKLLDICLAVFEKEEYHSVAILGPVMNVLSNLSSKSRDVATRLLKLNIVEKICSLKVSNDAGASKGFKIADYTVDILENIICNDEGNLRMAFKYKLKSKFNMLSSLRTVTVQSFLTEVSSLIEKNPAIFFEVVKENFKIRSGSRNIELKEPPKEKEAQDESSVNEEKKKEEQQTTPVASSSSSTLIRDESTPNAIMALLLNQLINSEDDRKYSASTTPIPVPALTRGELVSIFTQIMATYDCFDTVLQFEHEKLYSSMNGENKFLYFAFTNLLPSTVQANNLITEICAKKPHVVFLEMVNVLNSISEMDFPVLKGVCDFLSRLVKTQTSQLANIALLLEKYDVLSILSHCSNKLSLDHPSASSTVNYLLTTIDICLKATGSSKRKDVETTQINSLELTQVRTLNEERASRYMVPGEAFTSRLRRYDDDDRDDD
ncbi:hypothetical protein C9374_003001 [Naegleria lovaniensis]|uniref:UBA domain-containing protein n=1 Tax=Naegleria lovaniensis TaxID=51637 RepID=A0AA88GNC2_NAELO|nr:uncharacterized protein C9374_003001 [Naegleria lovaniensis]KAG2385852.1 hypothetical protein C9374_003001 [Naegleria lovaniensis]